MYRKKFERGPDVSPDNPVPQWNAGWFGLQLGGTLWLLIMAVVLVGRSSGTAALVFGCFLIPNLFGTWLWFSRVRLSVYRAARVFLPILGLFSILAVFIADRAGQWTVMGFGGPNNVSATSMCVLILILVVALMILFHVKERRHLNVSRSDAQPSAPLDADIRAAELCRLGV